jgi:hypothetical protein
MIPLLVYGGAAVIVVMIFAVITVCNRKRDW